MQEREKISANWKKLCAVSVSIACLGVAECSSVPGPPAFNGDIFLGDTDRHALVRCISPEDVNPCEEWDLMFPNDVRFDEMMAVKLDEYTNYREELIDACKEWR